MLNKRVTLIATILTLTGCASWPNPPEQSLTVNTFEDGQMVAEMSCELVNDKGRWQVTTPGRVTVATSSQDLVVTCTSADLPTGTSSAVARPWPDYLEHPATGVLLPVGSPSTIDQKINGVPQRYPENIDVVLGQAVLVTADQTSGKH
jgi:hypothetical protein